MHQMFYEHLGFAITLNDLETGPGLASAWGIIRNHHGLINAYSEEGEGSTFNIYLPASDKEIIDMEQEPDELHP